MFTVNQAIGQGNEVVLFMVKDLKALTQSMSIPLKILLIDDEPAYLDKLVKSLEHVGFECRKMTDSVQATELLKREKFDVVITDISMPGRNGFEVIEAVRSNNSAERVIAISGQLDRSVEIDAIRTGADAFIAKPIDLQSLIEIINKGSTDNGNGILQASN